MDSLSPLLLFAIVAAFTPGPNNIMIMASGLNHGSRASLPHYFGICLGFPAMFLAVGFGLGVVFELYPVLHTVIKVLGTLYLVYLAWLIATSVSAEVGGAKAKPLSFIQAALFQWVNPKAWIMGTSAIAAFTAIGPDMNSQIMVVWLVFTLTAFPAVATWMLFGVVLQNLLSKPIYLRVFNFTMAALLIASIWPIVTDLFLQFSQ